MGDTGAALTEMWRSVLVFVPTAIAFLAIIAIGTVLALVLRRVVNRGLERVGFDRLVRRGGLGRAVARHRYEPSDLAARLVHYGLLLLTLHVAFGVWGPNPVSALISAVVAWLPRVLVAIVLVVVAAALASGAREVVSGLLAGLSYGRAVARLASWSIVGLGVIAALNQVGIATTVTTPVLVTALAMVAGVTIVGVGGGLVRPMAQRWERWLDRAETDAQALRDRAETDAQALRDRAHAYAAGRGDVSRRAADPLSAPGSVPGSRPPEAVQFGADAPDAATDPAGEPSYAPVGAAREAYPGGWPVLNLPTGEVGATTVYRSGHAIGRAAEPSPVADPEVAQASAAAPSREPVRPPRPSGLAEHGGADDRPAPGGA